MSINNHLTLNLFYDIINIKGVILCMKKVINLGEKNVNGGIKSKNNVQLDLFNKREKDCLDKNKNKIYNYIYNRGIPIWAAQQEILEKNGFR